MTRQFQHVKMDAKEPGKTLKTANKNVSTCISKEKRNNFEIFENL